MTPRELSARPVGWLGTAGPSAGMALSSRVRLARNLRAPFPHRADGATRRRTYEDIAAAGRRLTDFRESTAWNFEDLSRDERRVLLERHLASPALVAGAGPRGVLAAGDERLAVMINEEDHVRIQSVASGLDVPSALREAQRVDRALELHLEFAVCTDRGYLTACPSNAGTGLRASVLVHLPALVLAGEIRKVHRAVGEMGMAVRGWFGEGSRSLGDFFQISNQRTLGRAEEEIVEKLDRVVQRILALETEARERLKAIPARWVRIQDRVHRSAGVLATARMLTVDQVMACVSDLRLGLWLGLTGELTDEGLNRLALFAQPGHLGMQRGETAADDEERWARAEWVRGEFSRLGGGTAL